MEILYCIYHELLWSLPCNKGEMRWWTSVSKAPVCSGVDLDYRWAPDREGFLRRRFFRGLFLIVTAERVIGPEWCLSHCSQTSRQSQQMALTYWLLLFGLMFKKNCRALFIVCVCFLKAPGTNVVFSGGAKTKNVCAFHCKLFVVVIWLSFRYWLS